MRTARKGSSEVSEAEQQRRAEQRARSLVEKSPERSQAERFVQIMAGQQLLNRKQTAVVLGNRSVTTVIRLEKSGLLTPVKFGSKGSQTFYQTEQVRSLAAGGRDD